MGEKQILHEARFSRLVKRDGWEYVERVGVDLAAIVIACTPEDELLLVEQYRIPLQSRTIELPAGLLDKPGEDVVETARRELIEETGYDAERLTLMAVGPVSSGITNERMAYVMAENLRRIDDGGGVPGENIIVHQVPMATLDAWLAARAAEGMMIDPKIYGARYFLALRS